MSRPQPSFFQWLFIYLTFPIGVIQLFREYGSRKPDINCIKKHEFYLSGKINSANSVEVSIKKVKKLSKEYKATLNDVMLGLATTVLKKYFATKNDETEYISLSCPFSFKSIPKKVVDYKYENDLTTALSLYVKLTDNVEEGIHQSKKIMDGFKHSLIPMASFVLMMLYRNFGSTQKNANMLVGAGKKHTMLWSNIPGYLRTVKYAGQKARRMYFIASSAGTMATGLVMMSFDKRL